METACAASSKLNLIFIIGGAMPSITLEAVTWAYRLLLGREPENESVIQDWISKSANIQELVQEFIRSEEFREKYPSLRSPSLTGFEPTMQIEATYSDASLQELFQHIQNTWQHLGETEPHFSVFTSELFESDKIQDTQSLFYATGQQEVMRLFKALDRNHIDYSRFASCLEYGCGVGRVTRWLAEKFSRIYGYDISQSHLRIAEIYLAQEKIRNVTLHHLRRVQDIKNLPKVDLVYSIIVLQHNPPPIIRFIVQEFINILNPGGIAFFQVPTYRLGYEFSLDKYLHHAAEKQQMEMHVLPQNQIFEVVHQAGGRVVEVLENNLTGEVPYKEMSNTFLIQKVV
jgi:SAM-dependent methyltransferase